MSALCRNSCNNRKTGSKHLTFKTQQPTYSSERMFSGEEDVDLKDKTVMILGCEGTPSNNELETLSQYGLQVSVTRYRIAVYFCGVNFRDSDWLKYGTYFFEFYCHGQQMDKNIFSKCVSVSLKCRVIYFRDYYRSAKKDGNLSIAKITRYAV